MAESNESTNKKETWLGTHWITIVLVLVGGIVLIGILKIISQFFTGNNPLTDGLKDVFGPIAKFADGITNGCEAQGACDGTDQESCNNENGCNWVPAKTSGDNGTCSNTTGRSQNSGSFFSTSCLLGMGSIFALAGSFLFLIIGPLLKAALSKKNEQLDAAAQISGGDLTTIRDKSMKDARETATKAKESLEKKNGSKLTDAQERLLGSQAASVETLNATVEAINNSNSNPEAKAELLQKASTTYTKDIQNVNNNADPSVSKEQKDEQQKEVEKYIKD